ncbi:hypothetical protein COCC4DRAFT_31067 [Bipolaris maydis ATCC 48331]|uniref:Uncharacterized protein n=2 Tax=Cochliobolus heterostrophus TaxID=5016 RepID=M2U5W9_COCH5|nr:uncharacterized protein COCC4DRAFT_31067 [Bipolaris maydis ATCC 48331]EMD93934.1 hypothetical protein COCHEDRAFT_1020105 [Bipolaris maydis C5]ENI07764.1 hypothetical protein COCC4DRAFT_31067 [Bipolaris maydis ATCC 48331]
MSSQRLDHRTTYQLPSIAQIRWLLQGPKLDLQQAFGRTKAPFVFKLKLEGFAWLAVKTTT